MCFPLRPFFYCCFLFLVKSGASSSKQLAITASNGQDVGAKRLRTEEQVELKIEIEDFDARIRHKNQPVLMTLQRCSITKRDALYRCCTPKWRQRNFLQASRHWPRNKPCRNWIFVARSSLRSRSPCC